MSSWYKKAWWQGSRGSFHRRDPRPGGKECFTYPGHPPSDWEVWILVAWPWMGFQRPHNMPKTFRPSSALPALESFEAEVQRHTTEMKRCQTLKKLPNLDSQKFLMMFLALDEVLRILPHPHWREKKVLPSVQMAVRNDQEKYTWQPVFCLLLVYIYSALPWIP